MSPEKTASRRNPRRSLSTEGRRTRDGELRGHLSAHRGAATYGLSIGFVPGPMVDSPAEEDGFELAVPPRRERLWAATPGKHCRFGPEPVSGSAFHAAVSDWQAQKSLSQEQYRRFESGSPSREKSLSQERYRRFESGSPQQRESANHLFLSAAFHENAPTRKSNGT